MVKSKVLTLISDGLFKRTYTLPNSGSLLFSRYESAQESDTLRSRKFMPSPSEASMQGWWTYPYYSCEAKRWLLSYTVPVSSIRG